MASNDLGKLRTAESFWQNFKMMSFVYFPHPTHRVRPDSPPVTCIIRATPCTTAQDPGLLLC